MLRLGLLSTARINGAILGGAAESALVEVVAVASRDAARAREYAREHGIARAHGSYDDLLADPDARGAFVGLELRHDRGALCRAVLEGVAYGLRDSFELLRELGVPLTVARASGGGARARLWLEIVASVLGVPLELSVVEEGSAFGAALLGGVAAGVFADSRDAVARCVHVSDTVEPNTAWTDAYEEGYARYRRLYLGIKEVV